jgi:hypothetical protein
MKLPFVWSAWWWVLIRDVTGWLVTDETAARQARARASVPVASTTVAERLPTMQPALLRNQDPSSWT